MKKRILSLLLAFAMAATLAPATALVGNGVSKAASTNEVIPILSVQSGSTWSLTGSDVGSAPLNLVRGTKQDIVIKDTANSALVYESGSSDTVVTPTIDVNTAATNDIALDPSGATFNLENGTEGKYEKKVTISVPANYDGAATGTLSLASSIADGGTGKNGVAKVVNLAIGNYKPSVTAGVNKAKYLAAATQDTGTLTINIGDMTGVTALGAVTYTATISESIASGNPMKNIFGGFSHSGQAAGTKTQQFSIPSNAPAGSYTYTVSVASTINGVAQTDPTTTTFTIVVGDSVEVYLDADGGKVNSVDWEVGGNNLYSLAASNQATFTFPDAEKDGYILNGWSNGVTVKMPGNTDTVSSGSVWKALWVKTGTSEFNVALVPGTAPNGPNGNTSPAATIVGAQEVVQLKIGEPIYKGTKFTANGYKFLGWSTEDGATVALYKPEEIVTKDMIDAIWSADHTTVLYPVWEAKTYTITFNPMVPEGDTLSTLSKPMETITKTFGVNIAANKFPENTYYIKGRQFAGWYPTRDLALGGSPSTAIDYSAPVTDTLLGNGFGELSGIVLYASWTTGPSLALLADENGGQAYKVVSGTGGAAANITAGESGKLGYRVEKWVDDDGVKYDAMNSAGTSIAVSVNKSTSLKPNYYKNPVEYTITYRNAQQTTEMKRGVVTVDDGNITLHQSTRVGEVLGGWTAYAGTVTAANKIGFYTTTAPATELISTYIEITGALPTTDNGGTIVMVPKWLPLVNGAKVTNVPAQVPYGTSLRAISEETKVQLYYQENATSSMTTQPVMGGVASVTWLSATPVFTQIPEKNQVFKLSGVVVPDDSVSAKGNSFKIDAEVRVMAKANNDTNTYAIKVADIPSIDLPASANAKDVYAALTTITKVKVTSEENKDYTVGRIQLKLGHDVSVGGASDWEIASNATTWTTWAATPDKKPHSFLFKADLSGLTATQRAGLTFVNNAFDKYAFVYINVAGAKTPTPVIKPEIDPAPEKHDVLATTTEEVRGLLDSNYTLRFRNKVTGEHLYTADWTEYVALMLNKNWEHETYISGSNTFKASTKRDSVYTTPVYRLFSSKAQEHLYTSDFGEVQVLVTKGWSLDNSTIYVSMDETGTAYYRQVRSILINGKPALQHHYAPKAEFDANLASGKGWRADNEGKPFWYSPAN